MFVMNSVINWAEKDKNRYLYLLGIINAFATFALIYVCYFGTYRLDYVNGELLVNPVKQIYTMIVCYGYALGLINGAFLCRRFLPFNPKEGSKTIRFIRGLIGGVFVIILLREVLQPIFFNLIDFKLAFISAIVIGLLITLVYPIIFTFIEKKIK